jgi:hypothetical protein
MTTTQKSPNRWNAANRAEMDAHGIRLWNDMAQRQWDEARQFSAGITSPDTDLRETQDPDVPYDPITEIDFLTPEEVVEIGDLGDGGGAGPTNSEGQ